MIKGIVAMDKHGTIGKYGALPWGKKEEDLKYFREQTIGQTVVMGRKTFNSLKKPLAGRLNLVLTRDEGLLKNNHYMPNTRFLTPFELIGYLEEAYKVVGDDDVWIIGGGEIYRQLFHVVEEWHITKFDDEYSGDVKFPIDRFYDSTGVFYKDSMVQIDFSPYSDFEISVIVNEEA